MKLSLAEPKYFKDSISIISELVNEARFKVTPDAIELVAMDPANVAMVIFKLLSSCFVEYDVKKEVDIGINLSNLKQVLRRAKPNDTLTVEMEDNKLKLTLRGATTRTFSLAVIDMDEKEQRVPELKFPVAVKTTSSILNDAIEDADIVGESVSFNVDGKKFHMEAEGDLSNSRTDVKEDADTKIISESKEKIRAKYSIEYLKKMIQGSKVSENVTIQFNKDYPLKLEYKEVDKIMLAFILAPRVDKD